MESFEVVNSTGGNVENNSSNSPVVEGKVTVSNLEHEPIQQPKAGSKPTKKLRHSNWFITVNTNKRMVDPDDPEMIDTISKLTKTLEKFMKSSTLGSMITFRWENTCWTKEFIKQVQPIQPSIEVGPVHGCIHAHFRLSIDHWCSIQLDLKRVPAFFKEHLGKGTYVSIKRFTSNQDVDDYIKKDNLPKVNIIKVTNSIPQHSSQ
jgi:hypothetical protein